MIPETLVGIVPGKDEDSMSVGIVDLTRKAIAAETFKLAKSPFDQVMAMHQDSLPPDLAPVKAFLDNNIANPQTTRVLMETPVGPNSADNKYFRLLTCLTICGYTFFGMGVNQDKKQVIIHVAMPPQRPPSMSEPEYARMKTRQVLTLPFRMGEAYTQFLAGACPTTEHAAIGAALIGSNMTLHHYLVLYQIGNEPSSGDLMTFFSFSKMLREAAKDRPGMLAAPYLPQSNVSRSLGGKNQTTTWSASKQIKDENTEKIPLEYAVAVKKFEYLGAMNAQKFAAMTVCRMWGMNFHYGFPIEENPLGTQAEPLRAMVDPDNPPPTWWADTLKLEKPVLVSSMPFKRVAQTGGSPKLFPNQAAASGGQNALQRFFSRFGKKQ